MKYKNIFFYTILYLSIPLLGRAFTELEPAGAVYPVVEPDIRTEIQARAAEQWHRHQTQYQQQIRTYQPANLQQLPKATQDRSFTVDMSYTLDRDLTGQNGKVLYPKGYTFNPLDYIDFTIGLVVIDGSDPDQITWFKKSPYFSMHKMKLLLSGGYAGNLISELNRAVFYLDKEIAGRFQLAAVPCVVVQQKKHIQVTEFFIEEEQ